MPRAAFAESATLPLPAFAVAMLSFAACCAAQGLPVSAPSQLMSSRWLPKRNRRLHLLKTIVDKPHTNIENQVSGRGEGQNQEMARPNILHTSGEMLSSRMTPPPPRKLGTCRAIGSHVGM